MTSTPSSTPAPGESFIERLGWRAERRPEPGFAHVLGAGAGAFLVFAMVALVIEITDDDATLPGVIGSLILLAAALWFGNKGPGPVRSACVTVAVLCVPLFWVFAFVGDGSSPDSGKLRGVYLLTILTYSALYIFAWTRGRAILLGLALVVLFSWIVSEVQGGETLVPFETTFEDQTNTPFEDSETFSSSGGEDNTTESSATAFVLGIGALAAGWALDKRSKAGAATPFIAVGALFGIVGGTVLGAEESVIAGGLLAAASGAVVGLVGGLGDHRRASTWIGVLAVVGGIFAVIFDIAGDSALAFAGMAAVVAAGLGAAALFLAPKLEEWPDGDEKAPKPAAS